MNGCRLNGFQTDGESLPLGKLLTLGNDQTAGAVSLPFVAKYASTVRVRIIRIEAWIRSARLYVGER